MITKNTAVKIAYGYAEIEAAEKLLETIATAKGDGSVPDFRDAFGRRKNLTLGVPSGEASTRLLDVGFPLAEIIIKAHIQDKRSEIEALCQLAKSELEGAQAPMARAE